MVNIGIGGSDLGPAMAYEALRHLRRTGPSPAASCPTSTGATYGRGNRRPRPGRDAFHSQFQDVHHAGDLDQRPTARSGFWRPWGTRRRGQAFRGRLDQRQGGGRVRHRYGQHVRVLGLGRRTLLRTTRPSACR